MMPPTPLRSISESTIRRPSISTPISAAPRQLLVAEEMDSFFPFDPFKLPLSSVYIEDIYRDWIPDEESETENSDSSTSDTSSDNSDSDDDDDDDEDTTAGMGMAMTRNRGLAVPGAGQSWEEESDIVSRSFEAMSLSPERGGFGGRDGGARPIVIR